MGRRRKLSIGNGRENQRRHLRVECLEKRRVLAVSGIQFHDADFDGEFDAGELPLPGVTVYVDDNNNGLRDAGEPFDLSDSAGAYLIENVDPGTHWVRREWPIGYEPTATAPGAERLIGLRDVADTSSPTGEFLLYRDIDPLTGAWLSEFVSNVPIDNPGSASTDGRFIYIVDNALDVFQQVTPQGGLVFSASLPPNEDGSIPYTPGPMVVGNQVYVLSHTNRLHDWDPVAGAFTRSRTVQIAPEVTSLPNGLPTISGAIAESLDGETILLFSFNDDRVFEFNPKTATVTNVFTSPFTTGSDWSAASLGNELFLRGQGTNQHLLVFDPQFNSLRNLGNPAVPSLLAGTFIEYGHQVDTTNNVTLDQGYRRILGTVSGVVSNDLNGDGVFDANEQGITGVTVFLDLNDNQWPDPGEPLDVTGSDGRYTIEDVLPGDYVVRAVPPRHFRASESYSREDRLFAVNHTSPSDSLRLYELDPTDGSVIETQLLDIPKSLNVGLEFDGQRLLLSHHAEQMIYELATDGSIIDSRPLGEPLVGGPTSGFSHETDYGPVTIQGVTYHVRETGSSLTLMQYVPEFNSFVPWLPVTWDWGLETIPVTHQPSIPSFGPFAAGASADGMKIVLASDDGRDIVIDPRTGIATFETGEVADSRIDTAYAGLGGKHYKAFAGEPIEVYDDTGTLIDTWPHFATLVGLGGSATRVDGVSIELAENEALMDVNHFLQSTLSSIAGTAFDDTNANGIFDPTEVALANVDVYVDINRNRLFDFGEPVVPTDSSGAYSFEGVPEGEYLIRQMPVSSRIAKALANDEVRLFGLFHDQVSGDVELRELDPVTGRHLRTIPTPGSITAGAGLALDDDRLYIADESDLFVIDVDTGDLRQTITMPFASISGIAILGGTAYLQDFETNEVLVFDLLRQRVIRQMDLGLINNGVAGSIDLTAGLGEAADEQNLAIQQATNILIVDPLTGLIVDEQNNVPGPGLAGAGGELFVARTANTRAYDKLGLFRRDVSGLRFAALGAGASNATAHRVAVLKEESLSGLDFSNVSDSGVVSGVQFEDINADAIQDPGEFGIAGVTVFADFNANNWPDVGEPQTFSNLDGSYSLEVPLGRHLIRTRPPAGFETSGSEAIYDRLFALDRWEDSSNPPNEFVELLELDPSDGRTLTRIETDIPYGSFLSMAYDGRRLILTDNERDTLTIIGTDGSLIAETSLPGNGGSFTPGPVVINGTIYLYTAGGGLPVQLVRFDPESMQYYGAMPISRLVDQDPIYGNDILPPISSLSESADGQSILATSTRDARVFEIDPMTARMIEVTEVARARNAVMATGLGGEWLMRGISAAFELDAYDEQFNLLRSVNVTPSSGLAGGTFADTGTIVEVAPVGAALVDSGQHPTSTTVSGVVSRDSNENGQHDSGEELSGLTVYLDANRNGLFDNNEDSTVSQTDGSYEFVGLLPGDYTVRVATNEPVTTLQDATFVYALEVDGAQATIRKHDPITNEVLREFPAPGTASTDAGLAVGPFGVYYASPDGFWALDFDDGEIKGLLDLSGGTYSGVAAIGEHAFVLDSDSDVITKIDPTNFQIVATLDINSLNGTNVDLLGSLGETPDGTRLLARAGDNNLVLHPDTGIIEQQVAATSSIGLAGANGEIFRSFSTGIRVADLSDTVVRQTAIGYFSRGIGAAAMNDSEHRVRAATDIDFPQRDFLIRPLASIAGTVFNDNDYDQTQGVGEAGVAGVSVYLDTNFNGSFDTGEPTQLTTDDDPTTEGIDESGQYEFTGLASGTYSIRQDVLEAFVSTTPSVLQVELTSAGSTGNDFGQTERTRIEIDYGDPDSRSMIDSVIVSFSEPVDIDSGAFQIENLSDPSESAQANFVVDNSGIGTVATLTFSGDSVDPFGSLKDGNYRLTILSSHVRDAQGIAIDGDGDGMLGGDIVDDFFRLFGDTDGDRDVDGQDLGRFGRTFLKTSADPEFNAHLDSDRDGDVDGQDFARFGQRFLATLPE